MSTWSGLGAETLSAPAQLGSGGPERLRDETLQTFTGLLPPQSHLGRHHPLPLDDQDALVARAVLEAAVALVALQPGQHAVVPAARALGGPLERRARLRHRTPHVQVGRAVAVHVSEARTI